MVWMITKEKKKRICLENKKLLHLVYVFGAGVMFKQHIQRYFSLYEGVHEIETSKRLLELKQNEIIEYHNIFGSKVVKLKKFAVYYLLEQGREDVSSINFTAGKAKKSAFLNEIILTNKDFKEKWSTLEDLFRVFGELTTYFSKQKETYKFLEKQIKIGNTTTYASEEVEKLILHKELATKFVKTGDMPLRKEFNLNSIQAASIYLGFRKAKGNPKPMQQVDILDLNGMMTVKKFVKKVISTTHYLEMFFDNEKIGLHFNLYVQSADRKKHLLKSKDEIDKLIMKINKKEISWEVVDLKLESTLFRNQKVLLSV